MKADTLSILGSSGDTTLITQIRHNWVRSARNSGQFRGAIPGTPYQLHRNAFFPALQRHFGHNCHAAATMTTGGTVELWNSGILEFWNSTPSRIVPGAKDGDAHTPASADAPRGDRGPAYGCAMRDRTHMRDKLII